MSMMQLHIDTLKLAQVDEDWMCLSGVARRLNASTECTYNHFFRKKEGCTPFNVNDVVVADVSVVEKPTETCLLDQIINDVKSMLDMPVNKHREHFHIMTVESNHQVLRVA